ncbi:MAG: hypothetical protein HY699_05665 [Deltaproteobacteria bacterium]|nr:hypothetical protein [Deltaproteobacteria bacterium]
MGNSRRFVGARWAGTVLVGLVALGVAPPLVSATIRYGSVQLSGNLETQNLIRHPEYDKYQFVQNRNTFRLRFDWDWLQNRRFLDKFDVPFIERSKLFLLYRGVYDGFYDLKLGDNQMGQTHEDDVIGGRISDLTHDSRTALKYENRLREAYIDLKLKDAPISFRLGRQQIIWGESDQFRIMDIWNPLDITWHFQQESWDNIRIPEWVGKMLWDIGEVGPFSNTFAEVVYNPFDYQPGIKAGFLPQPWALPFPNPLREGQVQQANEFAAIYLSPTFNLQGTSLRKGDFKRNPEEASEVGVRTHAVTSFGLEFALNYIYGRGRGVGASSPFAVKIDRLVVPATFGSTTALGGKFLGKPVYPVQVDARVIHPYMHIFGLTANISEEDFLQTVLRCEMAYVMGEPHQTIEEEFLVDVIDTDGYPTGQKAPLGFTKRDVWAGMIGFDRPTWIRWLNSKTTWFLTGQFFWNYTTGGNIDKLVGNAGAGEGPYFTPASGPGSTTGGIGVWNWPGNPLHGRVERLQLATFLGNDDNIRQWEHLITFAGTSFYRGGTVVPFFADAWDPVNGNNEFLWNLDYYYSNDLILSLQQKFFMTYGSNAVSNDPWYAGGRFTRRDETGVKITYQF